jgi:B12 binding domain
VPEDPGRNASRRDSDLAVRRLAMRFTGALRTGDSSSAAAVVDEARALGFSTSAVYGRIVEPALVTIGELWERGALTDGAREFDERLELGA